ncbi:hypothetical protein OIE63_36260 [Streptomyces sp. NBC_01795]|uniref:hypothetical protein n=1 Tax=unclassified Streptomyces TaxID=2593676 RepID=UPI002DD9E646|nr:MULTISPECIES: hypothetical protein [unclassified Streptomyces]WSA96415.1 hypothetical protein OIE63_36260 [Streptomyces sp. NBC_01795]WSB80827.1 hypothetical protein OHB04_37380 [Streptomyces sp. NBC_01775]WSS10964.1 hypothetical protein OG533_02880 [Streptomyces sp. NBC_01186]
MSTEPEAPALIPADEPYPAPTRRTVIATSTAVGGAVVAGGVIGGAFLSASEEATAAGTAPPALSP